MAENEPDDLLGDVRAAMTELETGAAPEREAPIVETPPEVVDETPPADGRARDESGRFKAKEEGAARPTLTLKKEPLQEAIAEPAGGFPKDAAIPKPLPPEIDKAGKHLERIPPPAAWKGSAKVNWDHLPRPVREEITAGWTEVETARAELAPLKDLIDTNRDLLVNQAGSVVEGQRQLFEMARMSMTVDGSIQLAHHILRARGLDPRAVFGGQPGQAPAQNQQQDPQANVAQLVDQEFQKRFQQQQTQQLQSQIDTFAGRADRPYFNDVRTLMGAMMTTGGAKTLDDAYDMACQANPVIREALREAERKETEKARAVEAAKARDASRASLRGSPLPGASNGGTGPGASVHDDVRAAFAEQSGA